VKGHAGEAEPNTSYLESVDLRERSTSGFECSKGTKEANCMYYGIFARCSYQKYFCRNEEGLCASRMMSPFRPFLKLMLVVSGAGAEGKGYICELNTDRRPSISIGRCTHRWGSLA
jgi:hypothetical protein